METKFTLIYFFIFLCSFTDTIGQNLITDSGMLSAANWNGQDNNTETTYLAGTACVNNTSMEVDKFSQPRQTINGFIPGAQYVLTFRYAWRTQGCSASSNPTTLQAQFTDAIAVLTFPVSVPNTVTTLTSVSVTFTNNASTSHTLKFTNPGNLNNCGVIIDDISIMPVSTPGGVGSTNLSAWFRAGSISITDGSRVYAWISSGNNSIVVTPPCGNAPVFKTGIASAANSLVANFNPYITFNGANQYLANTLSRYDLMDLTGSSGSVFAVHQGGTGSSTYFGQKNNSPNFGGVWMNTDQFQLGNEGGSGKNVVYTASNRNNIIAFNGNFSSLPVKDWNGTGLTATSNNSDIDYLTIGVRKIGAGILDQFYNGSLSEIIEFNFMLTNTQMQQVRSYLAVKYGTTLNDNSSTIDIDERNYLATDGTTTLWNYSANSSYHNNITVIGRDDNTALNQRKSISTDGDPNGITGGNAMLIVDNGAAFSADKSFLAIGHNGIASGLGEISNIPAGIQSRMKRIWKFQKTGTGVANSVSLSFDMTGYSPLTGSDLRLLVSTVNTFGTATTTVITGTYLAPYFTASLPTTGGVYFTIGSINYAQTPLPIELLNFEANVCDKIVCLNWTTATETNNDYFTIQRTKNGSDFEYVASVDGAGNSTSMLNYSTVDNLNYYGVSYYRLQQTDFNGSCSYSDLKMVNIEENNEFTFDLLQNPIDGSTIQAILKASQGQDIEVTIYDMLGKKCYTEKIITNANRENLYSLELSGKLPEGMYLITAASQKTYYSKKMIVQ